MHNGANCVFMVVNSVRFALYSNRLPASINFPLPYCPLEREVRVVVHYPCEEVHQLLMRALPEGLVLSSDI